MCAGMDVNFIDQSKHFYLFHGEINDGYLQKDGIHLNMKGTEKVIQNLKLKVKPSVGKLSTKHVKNSEKHFEKDINLVQEEQFSHKKRSKWESEIYNFSERRNGYDAKAKLQKDVAIVPSTHT